MESEKDFTNLEMNLVDLVIYSMDFVGLGVNLMDLGMHLVDLKICFKDLGMDSKVGSVGLRTDFMDGRHLGYFRDWCFGQME